MGTSTIKDMNDYKAGEYTIQEHVKKCGHLMNLPPRNYLTYLLTRKRRRKNEH